MQFVIDNRGGHTALVFQVDLWDASGEAPLDIPSANLRAMEIHSASRINVSLEQYKKMQKFRHALRRFLDLLPEQCQNDPEVQFLSEQARVKVATIVQLKYQANKFETAGKMFEFSPPGNAGALAGGLRRYQGRAGRARCLSSCPTFPKPRASSMCITAGRPRPADLSGAVV